MQPHGGTASPYSSEASNCRSLAPRWDWRVNRSPFLMAPRGHRIVPFGQNQLPWHFIYQAEWKVGRGGVRPVCWRGAAHRAAGFVVTCL